MGGFGVLTWDGGFGIASGFVWLGFRVVCTGLAVICVFEAFGLSVEWFRYSACPAWILWFPVGLI